MKPYKILGLFAFSLALTASCSDLKHGAVHDPVLKLDREDYKHMLDPNYKKPSETTTSSINTAPDVPPIPEPQIDRPEISLKAKNTDISPPIPDLAEIISTPMPPKLGQTKVVSISVTDDVPLKDILIELARLADVDVEIDSSIIGGITFRAKDRPFNEVIDRICDMAGLRYSMRNNVLRIERDVPYIQTYALDMLNIDRGSSGNIDVSSAGSGGSAGAVGAGGSSNSTGSSSKITAESKSDFWSKFQESVGKILEYKPTTIGANIPVAGGSIFASLNRQAGTLTFAGTERQHEILRKFLRAIEDNTSAQVLIEAKIVEVTLNDSYQVGIDWSKIGGTGVQFANDLSSVATSNSALSPASITVLKNNIFRESGADLSVALSLLDEFGTTRALSSPRLNAMNNQQAVLSFVENLIYFDVKIQVTDAVAGTGGSASTPAKVEVTSTPKNAPVGIVLTLQPSINTAANEITLNVRPTLSKVTKFITDPGFEISKANAAAQLESGSPVIATLNSVKSTVPQLEVRELDSILKVTSGQVMVIGGLLEDSFTSDNNGIPGVSDTPYIGNLFKSDNKTSRKKELVIFIRATIVPSTGNSHPADQSVYERFTNDPRPLEF